MSMTVSQGRRHEILGGGQKNVDDLIFFSHLPFIFWSSGEAVTLALPPLHPLAPTLVGHPFSSETHANHAKYPAYTPGCNNPGVVVVSVTVQ